MKAQKRNVLIVAVVFIAVAAVASFVFVQIKDRTYFHSPPYTPKQNAASDVLVIYYSRSGNTEAMAREIARKFNTFNSRFKSEEIDKFRGEIEKKGGRLIDHISIRRGRVYYQKSGEQLLEESQDIIKEKMKKWTNAQ